MISNECEKCSGSGVVILPVNGETDDFPCPRCLPNFWANGFPGVFTMKQGTKHWLWKPEPKEE